MRERFEGREFYAAAGMKPCFLSVLKQRGALGLTRMALQAAAEFRQRVCRQINKQTVLRRLGAMATMAR